MLMDFLDHIRPDIKKKKKKNMWGMKNEKSLLSCDYLAGDMRTKYKTGKWMLENIKAVSYILEKKSSV